MGADKRMTTLRAEWVRELMGDFEAAVGRLVETRKRESKRALQDRLIAAAESKMGAAFALQGRALGRRLPTIRGKFPTVEDLRGQVAGVKGQAALREALGEDDWGPLWDAAAAVGDDALEAAITETVTAALAAGAEGLLAELGSAALGISWKLSNPRAVAYVREHGAALVTRIDETTRGDLRSLIERAMAEGRSYDQIAEDIQTQFKHYYEPGSAWAFDAPRPQGHIDSRAHLIAVTETGNAYVEGNWQVGQGLKAAGLAMEKAWLTVGDDRVSEICLGNEAAGWIPMDEDFPSGDEKPLAHPACRCDLLQRVAGSGE